MAHRKCAVRRADMDVRSANTPYVESKRAFLVTSLHEQRSDSLAQRVKALVLIMSTQDSKAGFQLSLE